MCRRTTVTLNDTFRSAIVAAAKTEFRYLFSVCSIFVVVVVAIVLASYKKIVFHATMNTKWCTFPLETLLNWIPSECMYLCFRVVFDSLFFLCQPNAQKRNGKVKWEKTEWKRRKCMRRKALLSNGDADDIDTVWEDNTRLFVYWQNPASVKT